MKNREEPRKVKTKIGQWNRTTVPSFVRIMLNVKEDDHIDWIFDGENILVKKAE